MNLRIDNINFNTIKFQDINHKKQSNQTKYTTNSTLLPNYEYYKSLSFGKNIPILPPEDFLLPASCKPDKYQIDAAQALAKGNNTIVTAPTGTGKTAIANYAIKRNFEKGQKTFYTTPLKALSNQKYNDLKTQFGKENVGIMTGDRKENTDAPIIVMTTEIYRNMVASDYFGKKNDALDNLKTVIFDEFHYMGDPDRGSVWEESIMFSPNNIQILALSATVGNNKKIAAWIGATKSQQSTLVNVPPENRHVPLEFIMYSPQDRVTNNIKHQSHLNMRYFTKAYYDSRMSDTQINALNTLSIKMGFKPNNRGRKNVVEILRDEYRLNTVDIKEVQEFLNYEYKIPPEESHPLLLRLTDKKAEPLKRENGQIVASTVISKKKPSYSNKTYR